MSSNINANFICQSSCTNWKAKGLCQLVEFFGVYTFLEERKVYQRHGN
jgi:hypothetical protein